MGKRMEGVRARVNSAYAVLVRDIDAGRRGPAHERPPGLTAAHDGVQILTSRYRFGVADESERPDEGLLAKAAKVAKAEQVAEAATLLVPALTTGMRRLLPQGWPRTLRRRLHAWLHIGQHELRSCARGTRRSMPWDWRQVWQWRRRHLYPR